MSGVRACHSRRGQVPASVCRGLPVTVLSWGWCDFTLFQVHLVPDPWQGPGRTRLWRGQAPGRLRLLQGRGVSPSGAGPLGLHGDRRWCLQACPGPRRPALTAASGHLPVLSRSPPLRAAGAGAPPAGPSCAGGGSLCPGALGAVRVLPASPSRRGSVSAPSGPPPFFARTVICFEVGFLFLVSA